MSNLPTPVLMPACLSILFSRSCCVFGARKKPIFVASREESGKFNSTLTRVQLHTNKTTPPRSNQISGHVGSVAQRMGVRKKPRALVSPMTRKYVKKERSFQSPSKILDKETKVIIFRPRTLFCHEIDES